MGEMPGSFGKDCILDHVAIAVNDLEKAVVNGELSPFVAAQQLLNLFYTS